MHRVGHTGRAGNKGEAISFVTPREHHYLKEIESYIGVEIPERSVPTKGEIALAMPAFTA